MAGATLYLKDVENDTMAGIAAAVEQILNIDYQVFLITPFLPQITATRGQSKNFGMHVLFYGEPTPI